MRELPILVADDDPHVLDIVRLQLQERGYAVNCASNKKQLLDSLYQQEPILLLLDIRFGDIDGVELMQEILRQRPHLCIVMFTAHASIENAVDAIRHGAFDYLTKPIDYNRIKVIIERAIEKRVLTKRLQKLEQLLSDESGVQPMLGNSPALARTRELIATAAATDATVLILGESGTGKELVARSLHEQSSRAHGPFIPVNMATLPQELVESILFGHQKGAFTGAFEARMGCCEAADKGTLFLDEISEMELGLQSKLLRFLQDRTFQRVGSPSTVRVDVRVVAASNRDLKASVAEGRFREDLYYRLHVIPIVVPPLRERREDIPLLAEYFIQRAAVRYRKELIGFTESAIERLTRYNWPGNVRQLENLVERVAILCRGPWIDAHELPDEVVDATSGNGMVPERVSPGLLNAQLAADSDAGQPIDLLEKQAILNAMEQMRGNVQKVAKHLGLGQATVYRKIKRYGLDLHDWRRTSQIDKQPPN